MRGEKQTPEASQAPLVWTGGGLRRLPPAPLL